MTQAVINATDNPIDLTRIDQCKCNKDCGVTIADNGDDAAVCSPLQLSPSRTTPLTPRRATEMFQPTGDPEASYEINPLGSITPLGQSDLAKGLMESADPEFRQTPAPAADDL